MGENEELDIVIFEDDEGNQIPMQVIDYLNYEGKEYALITEYDENDPCEGCAENDCEGCADKKERNAYVMEVVPAGLDEDGEPLEEFVNVDDDALAEKLIEIFQNSEFDDLYEDESDEAEE